VETEPDRHLYDLLTNLNRTGHTIPLALLMIAFVMLSWGNRGRHLAGPTWPPE
jgi:hypothetical protein